MLARDLELVRDIFPGTSGSTIGSPTNVNGTLFFAANDGLSGVELWKSDGTEAGTTRVKDINPGTPGSAPNKLTNVGGTLFFEANDGASGVELWKSDGTEENTIRVLDIRPGPASAIAPSINPRMASSGGYLYLTATDGVTGFELWKSDGTDIGTARVKDIRPGASSARNQSVNPQPASVGGLLYFAANDGASGEELWVTDGTDAGTLRIKDLRPGSLGSYPRDLTNIGGTLYFVANDGANGWGLWRSDGTEPGTIRITAGVSPATLTSVGETLYFRASNGGNGSELWKSNGELGDSVLVRDIAPGSSDASPSYLTNVAGTLFFVANDGLSGFELWKSDGTENGTTLVKDITPGSHRPFTRYLNNVNGTLYFSARSSQFFELWKSDGTEAGTVPVRLPGNLPLQNPTAITSIDNRLFVVGSRPEVGIELFTQVLIDPPALTGDFDRSGVVDQADRAVWLADYGSGTRLRADGNGDGVVDAADFTVWRDNLGAVLPAAVEAAFGGTGDEGRGTGEGPGASAPPLREGGTGGEGNVASLLVSFSEASSVSSVAPWFNRPAARAVFAAAPREDLLLVPTERAAAVDAVMGGTGDEGRGTGEDGEAEGGSIGRAVRGRFVAAVRR